MKNITEKIYKFYGYDGYLEGTKNLLEPVEITVSATSEKDAIKNAKRLVIRKNYYLKECFESKNHDPVPLHPEIKEFFKKFLKEVKNQK